MFDIYHESNAHVELKNINLFTINVSIIHLNMFYKHFHIVKYVNVTLKDSMWLLYLRAMQM